MTASTGSSSTNQGLICPSATTAANTATSPAMPANTAASDAHTGCLSAQRITPPPPRTAPH